LPELEGHGIASDSSDGEREVLRARIVAILGLAETSSPAKAERLGKQLVGLGAAALPELFDALTTSRLPANREFSENDHRLTNRQEQAVFEGLVAFGRTPLRQFIEDKLEEELDRDERLVALRILARVGRANELVLAAKIAEPPAGQSEADTSLRTVFEDVVRSVLSRDRRGYSVIKQQILQCHSAIASSIVRAVSDVGTPAGMLTLADLLGYEARLDKLLLVHIGLMAQKVPHPIDSRVLDTIRPFLESEDFEVSREAVLAVGRLEDFDSIEPLIGLLESEDSHIAEAAHWSLMEVTGLNFEPSPERWRFWLQTERHWLENDAPALYERLHSRDAGEVFSALNELSRRRFHRDEIAKEIEQLLWHESPATRRLACLALGQLGAPTAMPALVDTLGDPEPTVSRNAWLALRAITGRDLPSDASGWEKICRRDEWAR